MKRVGEGAVRQEMRLHDRRGQSRGLWGNLHKRYPLEQGKSLGRGLTIPSAGLLQDQLGGPDLELGAPHLPPTSRDELMRGCDEVLRRSRGQVANYRSLEIDAPHRVQIVARSLFPDMVPPRNLFLIGSPPWSSKERASCENPPPSPPSSGSPPPPCARRRRRSTA